MASLRYAYAGCLDYRKALSLQERLIDLKRPTLLLLQHPPVITVGRSAGSAEILASPEILKGRNIEVLQTDRGGRTFLHLPGQLVGYPILDLREMSPHPNPLAPPAEGEREPSCPDARCPMPEARSLTPDIGAYLRRLEEILCCVLREYGIEGERKAHVTGVFVGGRKIAGIGVKVRGWWTSHGFALNVCPDLRHFSSILCCGSPCEVTSMEKEAQRKIRPEEMIDAVVRHFGRAFGAIMEEGDIHDLLEM